MAAAGSPLGPPNFPPCYLTAQTGSGVLGARSIALPKGDEKRAKSDSNFEAIGDVAGRSIFTRRTSHQQLSAPSAILVKAMQPVALDRPHTAHPAGNSPSLQLGSLSRTASFGNSGRSASTPHAIADVKTTLDRLAKLRSDPPTPFKNSAFSEYPRVVDTIPEQDSPLPTTSRTLGSGVISPVSASDHCFSRPLLGRIPKRETDSPSGSIASDETEDFSRIHLPKTIQGQLDLVDDLSPCSPDAPGEAQMMRTRDEFRKALSCLIQEKKDQPFTHFRFADDPQVRSIQERALKEPLSEEDIALMVRWFIEEKGDNRLKLAQRDFDNVPEIYEMFRRNLDLFSQVKGFLPLRLASGNERIDLMPPIKDFVTESEIQDFIVTHGKEKSSPQTKPQSGNEEEVNNLGGIPKYGSERRLPPVDYKATGKESLQDILDKYPVVQRQYSGERLDREKPKM